MAEIFNPKEDVIKLELTSYGIDKMKDGELRTLDVKEGDKVVYSYSTTEISIDGKNYLLMKESNILGVLSA